MRAEWRDAHQREAARAAENGVAVVLNNLAGPAPMNGHWARGIIKAAPYHGKRFGGSVCCKH